MDCASSSLCYSPSSRGGCPLGRVWLFNMRGCVGRRSGRCTPQLAAAQHMQADVDGRRWSWEARLAGSGSVCAPREVLRRCLFLRLFEVILYSLELYVKHEPLE